MDRTDTCGLPKTLGIMLDQLLKNNSLKGWSIYENRYKQICCTIRFDCDEDGDSASIPVGDGSCSYRRISHQQHTRNIRRAIDHNNKKRKLSDTKPSPESHRDTTLSHYSTYEIDTPMGLRWSNKTDTIISDIDIAYSEPPLSPGVSVDNCAEVADETRSETPSPVESPDDPPGLPSFPEMPQELNHTQHLVSDSISESQAGHHPVQPPEKYGLRNLEEYANHSSVSGIDPEQPPKTQVTQVLSSPQIDSEEFLPTSNNQSVKCPCCTQEMTVTHVCSDDSDNSEMLPPHVPPEPDEWLNDDQAAALARVLNQQQARMIDMITNLYK